MAITYGSVYGSGYKQGKIGLDYSTTDHTTYISLTVWGYFLSRSTIVDSNYSVGADIWGDNISGESQSFTRTAQINHTSQDSWSETYNRSHISTRSANFTKKKEAYTVGFSCSLSGVEAANSGGSMSHTRYITIPALPSYSVKYDANGGSGAPSAQTKWYNENLTLSEMKPTRTGYTFQGWGTSASDTSVDYAAGATYKNNAAITLYAIWKANTYAVTYDANGGSGAPSAQTKTYGQNLTLSNTIPTRENHNFLGWGIAATSTTASYAPGATYSTNAPITLYAIWELAYVVPTVTEFTVSRCNSAGTADDYGTYAKVEFAWETCQLIGTNNIKSIKIEWKALSASTYSNSKTVSASGISGTVSQIIGSGALDVDTVYIVRVTVTDSMDGKTEPTRGIPLAKFIMDILAGGKGVAFGKPAETENLFEVEYDGQFNNGLKVKGAHPQVEIPVDEAVAAMFKANRTDVGVSVRFGVATDGVKHGLYSDKLGKWLVHSDGTDVYLENNRVEDVVIEQGTSEYWTYRKWASGIAECFVSISVAIAINLAYYDHYVSASQTKSFPSGLFTAAPSFFAFVKYGPYDVRVEQQQYNGPTKNSTGNFRLAFDRSVAANINNPYVISLHAIGYWK